MSKELEKRIKELSKEIKLRDSDEWQKIDDNEYSWLWCGQSQEYEGRLEGMEIALKIFTKKKSRVTK